MGKKILAVVSEPVSADALRSAVGEGAEDAEVMVVAPALNTKRRFFLSDPDPAIGRAEAVQEETVGTVVQSLVGLGEQGVIARVAVVAAGSTDGTAEIAARHGAEVHDESVLLPEFGPGRGKGDAMWRALTVLSGDVVCYLDADSEDFGPRFALGVLGPILCEPGVEFVKGFYQRPFKAGGIALPEGGRRRTELAARPLLNL